MLVKQPKPSSQPKSKPKLRLTDRQLKDLADLLARTRDCQDYIQSARLACAREWLNKRRSKQ